VAEPSATVGSGLVPKYPSFERTRPAAIARRGVAAAYGKPTSRGANKWTTFYKLYELVSPLFGTLAGTTGGQTTDGPTVGTSLAMPGAMNSMATNTPWSSFFLQQPELGQRQWRNGILF